MLGTTPPHGRSFSGEWTAPRVAALTASMAAYPPVIGMLPPHLYYSSSPQGAPLSSSFLSPFRPHRGPPSLLQARCTLPPLPPVAPAPPPSPATQAPTLAYLAVVASDARAALATTEVAEESPHEWSEDEDDIVLAELAEEEEEEEAPRVASGWAGIARYARATSDVDDAEEESDDYQPAADGGDNEDDGELRVWTGRKRPRIPRGELRELVSIGDEFLEDRETRRKRLRREGKWREEWYWE